MTAIEFNTKLTLQYPSLYSFTKKFTRSDEDSQDLVQETIAKAIVHRDKFKDGTNLKGWLFTIMRNLFINRYRKEKSKGTYLDISENQYQLHKPDNYTFSNPQATLRFQEIESLIAKLPDSILAPFKMHYEGYKYHEIAIRLDIPIGTVKNRIFQARKELQSKVDL